MDEKARQPRAGSIMVRINGKYYETPDTFLFKSYDNKDIYLAGTRLEGKNWISTVKFVEENRFEDVPTELLEKFMKQRHRKVIIDNEEYDIPDNMVADCLQKLSKVSRYTPKVLNDLKKDYKDFIFKK